MTEQEYKEAVERTHIASGPAWNLRYLTALEANGLKLVPFPGTITDQGYYLFAPLPVPDQEPSWAESLIVPYYHPESDASAECEAVTEVIRVINKARSQPSAEVRVRLVPQEPTKPPASE